MKRLAILAAFLIPMAGIADPISGGGGSGGTDSSTVTNIVDDILTDGGYTTPTAVTNIASPLITAATNGLASVTFVQSATNGFVKATITNGLVTAAITNGLSTTTFATSLTNSLATTNYVRTLTNGFVTASITNGLGGGGTAAALYPGFTMAVGQQDWMGWTQTGGSTTNNACTPPGYVFNDSIGDWPTWAWWTSYNTVQDKYVHAYVTIPQNAAGWGSSTAMVVRVIGNTTNNYVNFSVYRSPDLVPAFTTNGLIGLNGSQSTKLYVIMTNQLPSTLQDFTTYPGYHDFKDRQFRVRADVFCVASNYIGNPEVFVNWRSAP